MNYVLIYKDNKDKKSYYYNFNDKLVYISDNKTNKCSIEGIIGIIIGFIFYLALALFSYYLKYSALFIVIMGIIFGSVVSLIANSTIKDIFNGKGKRMSKAKLQEMYHKNKAFRLKYIFLFFAFIILTILNLLIYKNVIELSLSLNFLLFTCVIMASFLFLLYRPINNIKFIKTLKNNNNTL